MDNVCGVLARVGRVLDAVQQVPHEVDGARVQFGEEDLLLGGEVHVVQFVLGHADALAVYENGVVVDAEGIDAVLELLGGEVQLLGHLRVFPPHRQRHADVGLDDQLQVHARLLGPVSHVVHVLGQVQ